jgi:hypothetical protein
MTDVIFDGDNCCMLPVLHTMVMVMMVVMMDGDAG